MDTKFFNPGRKPIPKEQSTCMFSNNCKNYTPENECDTPENYKTRPCYQNLLRQTIEKRSQSLFKNTFNIPPQKRSNKPLTTKQMGRLAKTTNNLFGGRHLFNN